MTRKLTKEQRDERRAWLARWGGALDAKDSWIRDALDDMDSADRELAEQRDNYMVSIADLANDRDELRAKLEAADRDLEIERNQIQVLTEHTTRLEAELRAKLAEAEARFAKTGKQLDELRTCVLWNGSPRLRELEALRDVEKAARNVTLKYESAIHEKPQADALVAALAAVDALRAGKG